MKVIVITPGEAAADAEEQELLDLIDSHDGSDQPTVDRLVDVTNEALQQSQAAGNAAFAGSGLAAALMRQSFREFMVGQLKQGAQFATQAAMIRIVGEELFAMQLERFIASQKPTEGALPS